MSHLRSGLWIGMAVNSENHQSQQFIIEIEVDREGTLTGRLISGGSEQTRDAQMNIRGQSSIFGAVHFECRVDDTRRVLFSGRFELPDDKRGVIWGSIILVYGSDKREEGTASLQYVGQAKQPIAFDHVWG